MTSTYLPYSCHTIDVNIDRTIDDVNVDHIDDDTVAHIDEINVAHIYNVNPVTFTL